MQVNLLAMDKRNKTHKSAEWVGTKKYPVYYFGLYEKQENKFTLIQGFPIIGDLSGYSIRCLYNYEGNEYEIFDGGDVEISFKFQPIS